MPRPLTPFASSVQLDPLVAATQMKFPGLKGPCLETLLRDLISTAAGCIRSGDFGPCFLKGVSVPLISFLTCQFAVSQQVATESVSACVIDAASAFYKGSDPIVVFLDLLSCLIAQHTPAPENPANPAPPVAPPTEGPMNRPTPRC